MSPDLTTLIAELEEAERSATAGPWTFMPWHIEEGPSAVRAPEGWLVASTSNDADARLIALMRTYLPALLEAVKSAQKLVSAVDGLISESHGVYGLHQNGDIAPWDTLTKGGQFEEWLLPLSEARAAL